jgi:orotidine-5'-phosphate decarboxylase
MKTFVDKLIEEIQEKKSILCVGLDPQIKYFPKHILEQGYKEAVDKSRFEPAARAITLFNRAVIEAIAKYAVIIKPQRAFYELYGPWGIMAFEQTVKFCKEAGLLVLEDAKRSDGGDTAWAYAKGHLGNVGVWRRDSNDLLEIQSLNVDAMTVMPQIGSSCVKPFVETAKKHGKGIFLVVKTSFIPNSEVEQINTKDGLKVWEEIASLVVEKWSGGCEGESGINNIGVVVGATYPEEGIRMRELLPDCFFLVPGYGAQGGGADGAIKGIMPSGLGVIVNSSRGINYAYLRDFKCDQKDFAKAAGKAAEFARDDLNKALKKVSKIPW